MVMPKGSKHSEESKAKTSATLKARLSLPGMKEILSKRHKGRKLTYSIAGEKNPMFGRIHSDETKQKIALKAIGREKSEEHRLKISKYMKGRFLGEKSPNWKGGVSFEPYSTNWNETLKRSIRERDHYLCQNCGKPQGDRAHSVHHIDYDKLNCNPNNLITLCTPCHSKTNVKDRLKWILFYTAKITQTIGV